MLRANTDIMTYSVRAAQSNMDSHVSYLNLVLNVSTLYTGHTTWLTTKTDLHCKRLWNEFPSFCEATVFIVCKYQQMPGSSEEILTNRNM